MRQRSSEVSGFFGFLWDWIHHIHPACEPVLPWLQRPAKSFRREMAERCRFQDCFDLLRASSNTLFDSQQKSNIQRLCLKWKARPKNRKATLHHLLCDINLETLIKTFIPSHFYLWAWNRNPSFPKSRSNCRTLIWKICIQLNTQNAELIMLICDTMQQHSDPHLRLCGKLTPGKSHLMKQCLQSTFVPVSVYLNLPCLPRL